MPQSMHRDACDFTWSDGACTVISRQSWTRCSMERSSSSSRWTLRKPLGSPMTGSHLHRADLGPGLESTAPFVRHHLHEPALDGPGEHLLGIRAPRVVHVLRDERADDL